MFYAGSVGSTVMTAGIPGARHYVQAAPMSAVMPGQHYYPAMHSAPVGYPMTAAPTMMYNSPQYAHASPYGYYGGQPTVIVSSPPSRRHRSRSRPRHGHSSGFLGYL
ncbi:hypothetical protein CPB83DRAFT_850285 [Crepidotus variabilis]|uniref:Uncharacterized protein n=1 Tax=Crepidotus variabilis TaxID=179855 RepID=A0A9P6EKV6_9AGAR|nr:hypothetical protein CPB83DRAFT_850285 [Crepidotus variabilis]